MAPVSRLRYNAVLCGTTVPTLGASLTNSGTTLTLPSQLNYQGGTAVPTIADPNYMAITLEPNTANEEIVWITAYTSAATTATILRAQESTSGVAHSNGVSFVHGPTSYDFAGDAGWTAVTFLNSWLQSSAPFSNVQYRKDGLGYVHLIGYPQSGSATTCFTLPAGYRPGHTVGFACPCYQAPSTNTIGVCRVDSSGNVTLNDSAISTYPTALDLDGVHFRAEL